MIGIRHVTEIYGGIRKTVDDVSSTIPTGGIIGFIGPSGIGKTTMIKIITGVLNPDEGETLINGKNIVKEPLEVEKEFGIVPGNTDTSLRLKEPECLNFTGDIYEIDSEQCEQRVTPLAGTFGVKGTLDDRILPYSHGMRQKIVIMGVLLSDPNVWTLDEPAISLDPQPPCSLKEMMKEHARKRNTAFFSTYVLEVVERLCDKVAIINRGRIVFFGTLEELKQLHSQYDSPEALFMEVIVHA